MIDFTRVIGIALAKCYVLIVGVIALLKAAGVPPIARASWAEVAYGPAITCVSAFLMLGAMAGIEHLVTARKGGRKLKARKGGRKPGPRA